MARSPHRLVASHALALSLLLGLAAGCGSEADHPLGGPHGSLGDPVAPGGGDVPAGDVTGPGSHGSTPGGPSADGGVPGAPQPGSPPTGAPHDDAGSPPGPGTPPPGPPTWSYLFATYLAPTKVGRCAQSGCHSSSMNTAAHAYSYLLNKGYISGTSSPLVDPSQSCLSWYGGKMPPSGPSSSPTAVSEFNAWAAAGAQNN